jgi:hypothetical protein
MVNASYVSVEHSAELCLSMSPISRNNEPGKYVVSLPIGLSTSQDAALPRLDRLGGHLASAVQALRLLPGFALEIGDLLRHTLA